MTLKRLKTPAQEARSRRERAANRRAARRGAPLPFPNPWDAWDPTKVDPGATPDEIHASYLEFRKLCAPRPRKRYTL